MIPFFAQSVPLPPNTPIPCLICKAESTPTQTFSGTIQLALTDRLDIFNEKTHQTMRFAAPLEFHGVQSSDGKVKDAPLTRATPGLLARITYRAVGGLKEITSVLLLTINQCRALEAAELLSKTPTECPD